MDRRLTGALQVDCPAGERGCSPAVDPGLSLMPRG